MREIYCVETHAGIVSDDRLARGRVEFGFHRTRYHVPSAPRWLVRSRVLPGEHVNRQNLCFGYETERCSSWNGGDYILPLPRVNSSFGQCPHILTWSPQQIMVEAATNPEDVAHDDLCPVCRAGIGRDGHRI
jgi:hypothetical protein